MSKYLIIMFLLFSLYIILGGVSEQILDNNVFIILSLYYIRRCK